MPIRDAARLRMNGTWRPVLSDEIGRQRVAPGTGIVHAEVLGLVLAHEPRGRRTAQSALLLAVPDHEPDAPGHRPKDLGGMRVFRGCLPAAFARPSRLEPRKPVWQRIPVRIPGRTEKAPALHDVE